MKNSNERGSVLVITLILFGIIIITALSVALTSLRQIKTSMQASKTNIAYQNADEGIDRVMAAILKGKKLVDASGDVEVGANVGSKVSGAECCSGGADDGRIAPTGKCNVSTDKKFVVTLLDSADPPLKIECDSSDDISKIAQIRSVGNDNASGTQRIVGANVQQKDRKIKLLLHTDTKSGSANFVDSSRVHRDINPHDGVKIGNPSTDSIDPNYGYASFDGAGDYLSTNDVSEDWKLGTGAFTVDFRLRIPVDDGPNTQTLVHLKSGSGDPLKISYDKVNHRITVIPFGTSCAFFAWTPNTGDWYHFAVVRDSTGKFTLFIDGSKRDIGTCNNSGSADLASITIGSDSSGSNYFKGHMDEFRLYSEAYWTTDPFTVPDAPY